MPSQVLSTVENNFTKGLVTEFTGLNFPENAATDTDNCTYTLVGDVVRRLGIDREENGMTLAIDRTELAVNTFEWNNVGGDGSTQLLVSQIGGDLQFFSITASTVIDPLSANNLVGQTFDLSAFVATGVTFNTTLEAQFSSGNGYLFVYHPSCDPVYCTYDAGVITGNRITVQIRDFAGVVDNTGDSVRPSILTDAHNYNLQNQGWITANPWALTSTTSITASNGSHTWTVSAGVSGIVNGQRVYVQSYVTNLGVRTSDSWMYGTVTGYVGTSLTINVTETDIPHGFSGPYTDWTLTPTVVGYTSAWFTAEGNYPSNSDQWWRFKNASGVFDPATTQPNVSVSLGLAPRGHFILSAFNQDRPLASGVSTISLVNSVARPTNGCWFQGRVWYTGVNSSQAATGTAQFTTWTENVYFSQVVNSNNDFGKCYQNNDPTSEELFDLLPTDGGVIVIQGSGAIYKLYPVQNGMLVFAANGIWFITGSQGIGFTANDYTITKISSIKTISTSSFVDVQGLPYFWNEEGIYTVAPAQGGGLSVNTITYNTIDSYYSTIPLTSKKLARGDYDPINYIIKWIFKSTEAANTTDKYSFDKILNFNTANKSFFPYTISTTTASINSINYISGPGGSTVPSPSFKYIMSYPVAGDTVFTFADEHDESFLDWSSVTPTDYSSYFITGFKLHGQGQRRFQIPYIYMYSRNSEPTKYKIQSIWDYAISASSGRWSTAQLVQIWSPNFGMVPRRHVLRGRGLVCQIKVKSVSGEPFDIMGWSSFETQNMGV